MRHKKVTKHFGRTTNHRKALFRNLIISLIEHERIETTVAKAKAVKGMAEKIVTLSKRGDLHSKRIALSNIPNRTAIAKLFSEIGPRFADRNGGYLRIIKTRRRLKDQAEMAVLEFIDFEERRNMESKEKDKAKSQ